MSIGDELLLGEVVDTNAAAIAAGIYALGIHLPLQMTVGDNVHDIVNACRLLAARVEAVVVTGGLGPTVDDVTAMAAAELAGMPLEANPEALAHLRAFAERVAVTLHPANEKQALLPAGAGIIANPVGTACGFSLIHAGCRFFFLPGVPAEMAVMLQGTVLPALAASGMLKSLRTKVFKVSGISEAELGVMLQGVTEGEEVSIAYCVDFPEIQVKVRTEADDEKTAEAMIAAAGGRIRDILGDRIVAEDADTIDTVVAGLFRTRGFTLALAESCTGGLIAKRITDLAGSSAYFLQGFVTYSNLAKIELLRVPGKLLEEKGAVSAEVAIAMARGARERAGSDLALAVTGIAGPDGGTAEKPVGTVFMAVADKNDCRVRRFQFHGDRAQIRLVTSFAALNWLRRELLPKP
nr:competence/damage-inducible protein A [Geotalea sp. SG265]